MSRLIVLSNRVKMSDNKPMAGGLAVALHDALIENSGIWMGWNGKIVNTYKGFDTDEFISGQQKTLISADLQEANKAIPYITTALTTKQHQHFYCGFANNVLWPLLHEQTDLISQAPEDYAVYQEVNRLFAMQLKKIVQPDDVIWVHDYHFLSVAYYCRQLGMSNRIGFFLHIPFVSLEFWQQLDQSLELIKHLAHYDVLGTQTQQDKTNCLAVFQHYLKGSFLKDSPSKHLPINASHAKQSFVKANSSAGVQLFLNLDLCATHRLAINAYPIGVNVAKIQQVIDSSLQSAKRNKKQSTTKSTAQQIIAVDRIDYSKGLLERFSAYRRFLQQYPMYQHQLKLLQIACPSRLDLPVYQRLYASVRQAVDDINQQFLPNECRTDTFKTDGFINNWQAITYSETVLGHEALMTAFWHSDIGWVNSLKDGMNLVAKEYIAAQNPENPGVLLLSRYAGAAEQMHAAVIIDPYQPKSIINGLKTALTMPLAQRKTRHQMLLQGLQQHDLHTWQQNFLDDLHYGKDVIQISSI
ncbi:trehalose-6-phosphate synthase [Psychrobacter frigidicola]|uniref:Trehalose-6-phosphate synthase n=1 Tax=Psychrobacter frigidicola TaxID=45611 RepID=A0A5C7AB57_9GAMM|nr:trehalose-6-phosphate synthase [Psychrobacter frigidicola]TXD98083.1 trehalose-6-phosphate synthase [Psychrobacter frigidicola]